MDRFEKTILTNMCMVYDGDKILVQDRLKKDWPGISFPGGHVEKGESFVKSTIREIYEETGLEISNPILCGVKQFQAREDLRYIILFFKTDKFTGELKSSKEGEVFWIDRKDLPNYKLAPDFEDMYKIFIDDNLSEFYYYTKDGRQEIDLY